MLMLTPPEVAKRLKIGKTKVFAWINSGELRAYNVGNGSQPRYRIHEADLALFLEQRAIKRQWAPKPAKVVDPIIPPVPDYFPHIQSCT